MRTDQDGQQHPTLDDVPTVAGWQHLAQCQECQARLGITAEYAASMAAGPDQA